MRIFVGPTEIAGFYSSLRRGMEAEGVDVMFADFSRNNHKYQSGKVSFIVKAAQFIERSADRIPPRFKFFRSLAQRTISPMRILVFLWASLRCDAFIYAYGGTITYHPEWELRWLRRLKRRIIFSFHGSDSRPPYFGHPFMVGKNATAFARCAEFSAEIKAVVDRVDRMADYVVENPFSSHFHAQRCINAQALGNPVPDANHKGVLFAPEGSAIRILHCPSEPPIKGSDVIQAAVHSLQAKGRNIEFIELRGRPNADVLHELELCDFVVDQAYSDTPMALFATEAASFGKPAIVGGYITPQQMAASIQDQWMPPVFYCHPSTLEDSIDKLCLDVSFRRDLGARALEFVREERASRNVARKFIRLAKGDVPEEWWFDPTEIDYVNGLGEENHIRRLIRGVVEVAGASALQLDHNPKMRDRVIAFSKGEFQ